MNEKLSYTEYLVVGSPRTEFDVGFEDYQNDKDMLKLTVDNKDVTEAGYSVERNVGNTLVFTPAVPVGSVVRIQRITDIDAPFYIFTAGNAFVPSNVDANFKQLLHSQQEVRDRQDHLEQRVIPVVDGLEEALKAADDAAKAAQEAKDAAEEAAQTTRSAANVIDSNGENQQVINDKVRDKLVTYLDFGAVGDGVTDDSAAIAAGNAWSSANKRYVSGVGRTYACHDVLFTSYCMIRDAKFLQNKHDTDLISVLTTATSREWLVGCRFTNIYIDGQRILATNVKVQSAAEDGGRHGIRIRRPIRDCKIVDSTITMCAADGIMLFPDLYGGGFVTSVEDVWIINCKLNWNRRHGGSSDRTNGLHVINTQMNNNGTYLDGHKDDPMSSGAQGDQPVGMNYYYGNGWDAEEYDTTTTSSNIRFINCEGLNNAKGGLLFLAYSGATAVNKGIQVIGGKYNRGVLNIQDYNAISVTPNTVGMTTQVFKNVVISNVLMGDTQDCVLLRNVADYAVTGTACMLTAVEYVQGYYDNFVLGVNSAASSKNYTAFTADSSRYSYNTQFNVIVAKDMKTTQFDSTTYGTCHQSAYLYNGVTKGSEIAAVLSAGGVSKRYLMDDTTEQLRVEPIGVATKTHPSAVPSHNGELVIAPSVDFKQIVFKLKGDDGTIRIGSLNLV